MTGQLRHAAWQAAVLALLAATALLAWRPDWLAGPVQPQAAAFLASGLVAGGLLPARAMRVATGLAHECGHALMAAACGGTPMRIVLSSGGSGACESLLPPGRARAVLVAAAGQQGPGFLALCGALALGAGRTDMLYAGTGLLSLLLLIAATRTRAGATAAGCGLLTGAAAAAALLSSAIPVAVLACVAAAGCGLLTGAGLRASIIDARRSRTAPGDSDEGRIARLTGLPVTAVAGMQAAASALLAAACLPAAW